MKVRIYISGHVDMDGHYAEMAELWEMEEHIKERLGHLAADYLSIEVDGASPVCRRCGCTNEEACEGGCSWVAADLCSACVTICGLCGKPRLEHEFTGEGDASWWQAGEGWTGHRFQPKETT